MYTPDQLRATADRARTIIGDPEVRPRERRLAADVRILLREVHATRERGADIRVKLEAALHRPVHEGREARAVADLAIRLDAARWRYDEMATYAVAEQGRLDVAREVLVDRGVALAVRRDANAATLRHDTPEDPESPDTGCALSPCASVSPLLVEQDLRTEHGR